MTDDVDKLLVNGEEADGLTLDVFRLLDRLDPIGDILRGTMTDDETVGEFEEWQQKLWWCPEIGRVISRKGIDGYKETDGDERVSELLRLFNNARLAWGEAKLEDAMNDGEDKATVKRISQWCAYVKRSLTNGNIKGCTQLWKACNRISVNDLNRIPYYLGTPEGVVNMRTQQLVWEDVDEQIMLGNVKTESIDGKEVTFNRGAQDALVTKQTRALLDTLEHDLIDAYDERWDEFVLEIMCGDAERAEYLQKALGYSIFGGNPEECMFVAYGPSTRNGKGTLLNSIVHALGDYATTVSPDFLLRKMDSSNSSDELASLTDVRMITMSEPPEGTRLDESKVKTLTGNDAMRAARKYCHSFTYEPAFTMWMMCNSLPTVSDTTVFTSGRMRVIPFERHFEESEQDPELKERFRTRVGMKTILKWLLDGYDLYLDEGLEEPTSIKRATALWSHTGGDDFRRFLDSHCEIVSDEKVLCNDFMTAYKKWCKRNDVTELTANKVTRRLQQFGIPKTRGKREYWYRGLMLKTGSKK